MRPSFPGSPPAAPLPPPPPFQLPDAAILLGFPRGSASPPKRCLCSLFRFVLPAIEKRRGNLITPARLGDVPALDPLLHNLPLLFRSPIYAWFPAHVASCWEALIIPS